MVGFTKCPVGHVETAIARKDLGAISEGKPMIDTLEEVKLKVEIAAEEARQHHKYLARLVGTVDQMIRMSSKGGSGKGSPVPEADSIPSDEPNSSSETAPVCWNCTRAIRFEVGAGSKDAYLPCHLWTETGECDWQEVE